MTSVNPAGRRQKRIRRAEHRRALGPKTAKLNQRWRTEFLARLGETSNVRQACEHAGVHPSTVYDLRRRDLAFAQKWADALCEGYDNLEMEMLHHLRSGEPPAGQAKINFAVGLRMLLAHREAVGREKARRIDVDAAEIRASIERKVLQMRERILARETREAEEAARGEG